MAWRLFNWGSRGPTWETDVTGVYVATILIPHCVQVNIMGHTDTGEQLITALDVFTDNAVPTITDVGNAANNTANWVNDHFIPDLATDKQTVDQVIATSRAVVDGPQATAAIGAMGGRTPATGQTYLPNNVTIALKKSSQRAGRSYKGRLYAWPFLTSDLDLTNKNQISPDFALTLFSVYGALNTALTGDGLTLGVASNVLAACTAPIDFILVDRTIDSQRRRLPGRGA